LGRIWLAVSTRTGLRLIHRADPSVKETAPVTRSITLRYVERGHDQSFFPNFQSQDARGGLANALRALGAADAALNIDATGPPRRLFRPGGNKPEERRGKFIPPRPALRPPPRASVNGAARLNGGGFKSASTPENPDSPWFFSESATGSRAQFALIGRCRPTLP
jgi:hypothetical protein